MLTDSTVFLIIIMLFIALVIYRGIKIVPQQEAWILERLGRYDRTLQPGLNLIIPFIDNIAYKHTLKEQAMNVAEQTAITNDNVSLVLDGVLYVKIIDPVAASYGISNPFYAITQLAQTAMRSEIGKMTMDKTFEERENMNINIVNAINEAATSWGTQCMRYEIKDISPPATVVKAMELQVAAERQKRAEILESEGKRQSQINLAEGYKQEIVLRSEAAYTDQINRARGQAEAVTLVAEATSKSIEKVATSINQQGGTEAVSLRVAEQYIEAFKQLAKDTNTTIIPANISDAGGMITQALTLFDSLKKQPIEKSELPWKNKENK
ncbi:MAG: SPFH domain-containing protein [Alphaproteobacteria bacterium]